MCVANTSLLSRACWISDRFSKARSDQDIQAELSKTLGWFKFYRIGFTLLPLPPATHTPSSSDVRQSAPPAISFNRWWRSRSLAIQEDWLVSHQCGKNLSFPILTIIPDEVSFAEVARTHQTSKEPFHKSLLLVLVKRGFTVSVDYRYFGFGLEWCDEGSDEVEVLFRWWVEMRLLLVSWDERYCSIYRTFGWCPVRELF